MDIPWVMLGRLLLATTLGALVGLERERHGHPAGLRTHILVGMGSALATIVSLSLGEPRGDPGRVAAQVVTGVGFLGAGAIIREGATIRGLTTAASIWATAMLGMAAGASGPTAKLATIATVLMLLVLWWLHHVEKLIAHRGAHCLALDVEVADARRAPAAVMACAADHGYAVNGVEVEQAPSGPAGLLRVRLRGRPSGQHQALVAAIASLPEVRAISVV
jgi:putative Mg2+ transporter-C (MgtC) family protein